MIAFAQALLGADPLLAGSDLEAADSHRSVCYPDYSSLTPAGPLQTEEILLDMDASEEEFQKQLDTIRRRVQELDGENGAESPA